VKFSVALVCVKKKIMTGYNGGKQKIGKKIAQVMRDYVAGDPTPYLAYVEPFVGMMGVFRHVISGDFALSVPSFIAGDINESVIKMWTEARDGLFIPPNECSLETYLEVKEARAPSALRGFIGHQVTFRNQYFGGFEGLYLNPPRDVLYFKSASNRVIDIATSLRNAPVHLYHSKKGYDDPVFTTLGGVKNNIIYCDPPYRGRSSFYFDEHNNRRSFDSLKFWKWCDSLATRGNLVFVSEYSPPPDGVASDASASPVAFLEEVWSNGKEKLFVLDDVSRRNRPN